MDKLLVICGPNAVGKSNLAIRLAKKFNGEVISADSRQIYKGLDIGSGKITRKEKQGIPHHLLDVASPKERFTVSQYSRLAREAIKKILKKGKLPILCGGTGFYIQAVVDGLVIPEVSPDWKLREKLERWDLLTLQAELKRLDKLRWERMNESDRLNPRRLIRALEIIYKTRTKVPPLVKKRKSFDVLIIGVTVPTAVLRERIKERLLKRLEKGMMGEVRRLHDSGISWKRLEEFGLEYRWSARFLEKKVLYKEMSERLYLDIIAFARRQMTWFKKALRRAQGYWFDISKRDWEKRVEKLIFSWYTGKQDAQKN